MGKGGWAGLVALLFSLSPAYSLTPMEWFNSLVAGQDDPGFRDGDFEQAQFNHPLGLVINDDGSRLFVADTGNDRLRVIDLDENNRVETLAGTGTAGKQDCPLDKASFDQPGALVWIPPDRLAVYDGGSRLLRLVNLKSRMVSTLGTSAEGKGGLQVPGLWNLAYLPKEDALYFSQPETSLLQRMDLKTGKAATVVWNDPRFPAPKALCVSGDKLYAADQNSPTVFEVRWKSPGEPVSLVQAGTGDHVLELAASGEALYALQKSDAFLARVVPNYQPVSLATPWGFMIDNENPGAPPFLSLGLLNPLGMAASPREERKFYISNPGGSQVISVKDYGFDSTWADRSITEMGILSDFQYPEAKPPKTFRILVIGNSRVITAPPVFPNAEKMVPGFNGDKEGKDSARANTFPKQLELILNTQAALKGVGTHFEVLTIGRPGEHIQFFANEEVPPFVQKYQADLVLALVGSFKVDGFEDYYRKPMTSEGIPTLKTDTEFLLKPWKEKIPPGAPARLWAHCKEKGWARATSATQVEFSNFGELLSTGDKEVRDDLVEMLGRPLKLLTGKLKPKGKDPVPFLICYAPALDNGSVDKEVYRSFWRDLCSQNQLNLLDLTDPFNALKTSYYPTSEACCHNHYTIYGNYLIATLLGYYLPDQKWVPFEPGKP
jgi:hypothetical protein